MLKKVINIFIFFVIYAEVSFSSQMFEDKEGHKQLSGNKILHQTLDYLEYLDKEVQKAHAAHDIQRLQVLEKAIAMITPPIINSTDLIREEIANALNLTEAQVDLVVNDNKINLEKAMVVLPVVEKKDLENKSE